MSKATTTTTATTRTIPPSLSHFVVFNPTIKLDESVKSHQKVTEGPITTTQSREPAAAVGQTPDLEHTPSSPPTEARDRDLEDDLREAAQILFYTSRSSRNISRNTMLKQTGLIRGLMGFSDMLVPSSSSENFISIKSSKSRLIVYKPEPDFFIGVDITLAHTQAEDGTKEAVVTSQGLSDALIRGALERGYADFRVSDVLHKSASYKPKLKGRTDVIVVVWRAQHPSAAYAGDLVASRAILDQIRLCFRK